MRRWVALVALCAAPSIASAAPIGAVVPLSADIVRKAPECAPLLKASFGKSGPVANIWESAKLPALDSHCRRLQSGVEAYRDGRFLDAIEHAKKAELDTPGQPGPWVVRGQAYARWGKPTESLKEFEKAIALNPRSLDDAETLDDYGSMLVRAGKFDEARKAYRSLLPRVAGPQGLCGVRTECEAAGLAYLTAGVLALEQGPTSLDEAVAILREARTRSEPMKEVRRIATLALALALDRRGDVDQARDLCAELAKTRGIPSDIPAEITARFVAAEEGTAMRAIGLESSDAASAIEAWKSYLSAGGEKRPWAAHAKAHLTKLEKGGTSKPAKPK